MASYPLRRQDVMKDGTADATAASGSIAPPKATTSREKMTSRLPPLRKQVLSPTRVDDIPFSPTHMSPTYAGSIQSMGHTQVRPFSQSSPSSSSLSIHAAFANLSLPPSSPPRQESAKSLPQQLPQHTDTIVSATSKGQSDTSIFPPFSTSANGVDQLLSHTTRISLPSIQTNFEHGKPTTMSQKLSDAQLSTPINSSIAPRAYRGPFMTPMTSLSVHRDSPRTSTTMTTPSSIGYHGAFQFSPARDSSYALSRSPATSFADSNDLQHSFTKNWQCDEQPDSATSLHWDDKDRLQAMHVAARSPSSESLYNLRSSSFDLDSRSSGLRNSDDLIDAVQLEGKASIFAEEYDQYRSQGKGVDCRDRSADTQEQQQQQQVGPGDFISLSSNEIHKDLPTSDNSETSLCQGKTLSPWNFKRSLSGHIESGKVNSEGIRESLSYDHADGSDDTASALSSATPTYFDEETGVPNRSTIATSGKGKQLTESPDRMKIDSVTNLSVPIAMQARMALTPSSRASRPSRPTLPRLNTTEAVKKSTGEAAADPTRKLSLSTSRLAVNTSFGPIRSTTLSEGMLSKPQLSILYPEIPAKDEGIAPTFDSIKPPSNAEHKAPSSHPSAAGQNLFEPSEILAGFLYLGPDINTLSELEYLKTRWGIKRIINAAHEVEDGGGQHLNMRNASLSGIEKYKKISMRDTIEAKGVQGNIEEACVFIDDARLHSAPVYVHCKAGKSRSVLLVMAYLIHANRWNLPRAYSYVVDRRRTVSPNIGFVAELMAFEQRRLNPTRNYPALSQQDNERRGALLNRASSNKSANRESLPTYPLTHPDTLSLWDHLAVGEDIMRESKAIGSLHKTTASEDPGSTMKDTFPISIKEYRSSDGRYRAKRPPADEKLQAPTWRATMAAIDSEHFFSFSNAAGKPFLK